MKTFAMLVLAASLSLSGCKFEAGIINGEELTGEGITFLVPNESNSSTSGSGGITFDGDSVKAETDGKVLIVNGLNYGTLSLGDIVDLRSPGKVMVNSALRVPAKSP